MRTMQFLVVGFMVFLTTGLFAQPGHSPRPQQFGGNVSVNIGFGQQRRHLPPPPPPVYRNQHRCDHPSHYRGHHHVHHHGKGPAHHPPHHGPHGRW